MRQLLLLFFATAIFFALLRCGSFTDTISFLFILDLFQLLQLSYLLHVLFL